MNKIIRPYYIFLIGIIFILLQYFGKGFELIALWGMLIIICIIFIKLIGQLFKKENHQIFNNLICLVILASFFLTARYLGASLFIKFNNLTNSEISNIKLIYVGENLGSDIFQPIDSPINVIDLNNLEHENFKWTRINKFKYSSFILKIVSNDSTSKIVDFEAYNFFRLSPIFKEIIIEKDKEGVVTGNLKNIL